MKSPKKPTVEDILAKHSSRIEGQIKTTSLNNVNYSREYAKFKNEMAPDLSKYERWCTSLGNIIKIKPSKKDEEKIKKHLEIAHLDVEPWQALGLGVMAFISVFLFGLLSSVAYALIKSRSSSNFVVEFLANFPMIFFILIAVVSIFLFYFVNGYPERLANKWRLKASSQMVPAILYIVVYMRHTPNLERAISFAAEHLQYPLSLDFKKVFYNVQIGKFSTIKESLDNYLFQWKDYSIEFVEAFHLIESSLFEPDNARRILTLEKSLQVILDGVYDKMLKFTHNVRSPLTNVYMLGVVLPTLGLALLPLASAMIGDYLKWYHVIIIFNLIVPFMVFYLTDKILLLRPGGHGESNLLEKNPLYPKFKDKSIYLKAFLICLPFLLIGLLPLIFQYTPINNWVGIQDDFSIMINGNAEKMLDFKEITNSDGNLTMIGPFGFGALLMSLFIPFGIALFFWISYGARTRDLIKERTKTKQLEQEFNNSLFQLGNRLGNGVPPELVFGKIAKSSMGLRTGDFFRKVDYNIKQLGMSVEKAIFHPRRGAIVNYPSELIATSMRVLIDSSKKGLKISAISLMSISEYVKNIQKITTRLRDMLAEIISDMKSNMTFLAPLLSGIVVGLAGMITAILNKMSEAFAMGGGAGAGNLDAILNIFDLTKMIPPYYLQIAIGVYIIQIIFILTSALVTIDSGEDKLEELNKKAKYLKRGILLYFVTAFLAIVALFFLTTVVLGNLI